jgi:hypothetical protein
MAPHPRMPRNGAGRGDAATTGGRCVVLAAARSWARVVISCRHVRRVIMRARVPPWCPFRTPDRLWSEVLTRVLTRGLRRPKPSEPARCAVRRQVACARLCAGGTETGRSGVGAPGSWLGALAARARKSFRGPARVADVRVSAEARDATAGTGPSGCRLPVFCSSGRWRGQSGLMAIVGSECRA